MDWPLLRTFILAAGWPVLLVGSFAFMRRIVGFYRRSGRSVLGRLLLVLVAGWFSTMYALGLTATAFMLADAERGVPIVLPVFIAWFLSMVLVYLALQWGAEAVSLESFYRNVQELERFKSQLLTWTAHELATPLLPMRVHLRVLGRPDVLAAHPDAKESVDALDRNFERLNRLVSEVQDLARLQNRRLALRPRPVDLGSLAASVVDSFRPLAAEAGVALELAPGPAAPVEADPDRTSQVLDNLLANAIKFTPRGGRVRISWERRHADWALRIEDSGVGLDAAQIAELFQPFSQVHPSGTGRSPGSGLGLYICRGIVEQHGGAIGVDSAGPGRGAAFWFTLPAVRA